jgi:hypothetical protein
LKCAFEILTNHLTAKATPIPENNANDHNSNVPKSLISNTLGVVAILNIKTHNVILGGKITYGVIRQAKRGSSFKGNAGYSAQPATRKKIV